jgi:FKBP-type peptidyl-prolyl cis-trans isomerase
MANSGPGTNGSQFCIMLGDRSYLDGDFTVFGDVVEGLDTVMRIVQGDTIQTVRIVRVGARAQQYHPTTEAFQAMVKEAKERAAAHIEKKRIAEREWIAAHYPKATGPEGGVLTQQLTPGQAEGAPHRLRYRGTEVRYAGDVLGREGPPIQPIAFASNPAGLPAYTDPQPFPIAKINPGLDAVVATMHPGERRIVIVPAEKAYGRAGVYPPEVPGQRRFVVSPNALLVYEVEVLD